MPKILRCLVAVAFLFTSLLLVPPLAAKADLSYPAQINQSFSPVAISAGNVSTLSITIYNPNAFALTLSNTPAAFQETLPTGLNFADPITTTTTCGGTVTASGSTVSLTGGTVPAQVGATPGSCTFTVQVTSTVPGNIDNYIGSSVLSATDPTGTLTVTNTSPSTITLRVNSVQPPSLSKSFSSNTIWAGQTSKLTIKITNNDLNSQLTKTSLTDNLPTNITVGSTTVTSSNCGSPTYTAADGSTLAVGSTGIKITNATVPVSGTCSVSLTVTSAVPGVYLNTIPANAIQTQQGVTNASAASAPLNVQTIGLSKSFSPSNVEANGTSTLTITFQNPSSADYTGVSLTDTLPSGMTVASTPNFYTSCNGTTTTGTVSTDSANSVVSLVGGTIPKTVGSTIGTCVVKADVTVKYSGTYTNSIPVGALVTDQGASNIAAATANLSVYGDGTGLSVTKVFSPTMIGIGGTSVLTINMSAPADTALHHVALTDALPTGIQVASTPASTVSTSCGGGTFAPVAGDTTLYFSGGTIAASAKCTITVVVTSSTIGTYTNTISPANISDDEGRNISANYSAPLTVSGLSVSKAFYPTTVNINGVTTLTITLTNINGSQLDSVAFTDTLPSGDLAVAPVPNVTSTCGSGVTATAGTNKIILSGGVIPAQVGSVPGICTINVDVVGKVTGTWTNSIAAHAVQGIIHGTTSTVDNSASTSASVTVNSLTIGVVKSFLPIEVFGGSTSTLSVVIANPNNAQLVGIGFTDNLPQGTDGGMSIALAPHASVGTCGGTISAEAGDTFFSFSGGSLAANKSCTLTVDVSMNVNGNLTNTIATGAVTSTNGAANTQPASAALTNLPGASISKAFSDVEGDQATLTISIQNLSNFGLDGLGFTDTFPSGVTVDTAPDAYQCSGAITTTDDSLTLTGGALADKETCQIVVKVKAAAAGSYENCILKNSLSSTQGATNTEDACDTLTVTNPLEPPQITKSFSPTTITLGSNSVVSFLISNPNTTALTGVAFSDSLPANMILTSVPNASQCGGTVTSTDTSLALTGGTIAASGSCTVTASATVSSAGTYENTTSTVTSTNGGEGNDSSASLTVVAPPSISKSFDPATILVGEISTLTFTINNLSTNTVDLNGVSFVDPLPDGITVASSPNIVVSAGCGSPTFNPQAGASSLTFSGGTVSNTAACTVSVDVTAAKGGVFTNTTGAVTSTNGGIGNTAAAQITVTGAGLTIAKTATTSNYSATGDILNYDYQLTNSGSATLYPPYTITDNKIGTITCASVDPLDFNSPNNTLTCSGSYTVTDADVSAKSVTNTAYATAKDAATGGNDVTSNTSSATVKETALKLKKSTSTLGYITANTTISYSYTITNMGSVTLYAPFTVSDNLISSGTAFTCGSVTSLAPAANVSCTGSYKTTPADVTSGSVTNIAQASAYDAATGGAQVKSNQDSVTVNKIIPPTIGKTFTPDSIAIGQTSTLTIKITNPNTLPLTGVAFSDVLPTGMTVTTTPTAAQCGGTVSWTSSSNTLALSGGSIMGDSCTVVATVTTAAGGVYTNTITKVTTSNGGSWTGTASATLTVLQAPVITKSFSPTTILEGGTSTLTLVVTNPSANTETLSGIHFTDNFPTGLKVAASPSATVSNCGDSAVFSPLAGDTQLTFANGTLASGASCTLTVGVTATAGGTYENTTNVISSSNGGDGVTSNTATLTVNQAADLSITKDDGKADVTAGEGLVYTVIVHNSGPSAAVGAHVYDTIPSSLSGVSWTCTADTGASCTASGSGSIADTVTLPSGTNLTYKITATVPSSATTSVVNTASVNPPAGLEDSDLTNNSATDTDYLNALTITKTASQSTYQKVGESIIYTYTAKNSGTSTLSSLSVLDNKLTPDCSGNSATLEPGKTFTCTGTHTITQSDLDNGSIANEAYATAEDGESDSVKSNTVDVEINAKQSPALTLQKSITSGDNFTAAKQSISYSYLVKNTGNVTLIAPFAVSDNKVTVDCSSAPAALAPLGEFTCTAAYAVLQSDVDAGSITNIATATGKFGVTTVTSNQATQTANAVQTRKLTLAKSILSGDPYVAIGDVISYSYVLKNDGNVTLSGTGGAGQFTVSDDKTNVTCPATPTSLAPGDSVTCSASYTATQGDLDSGEVVNTATGHSNLVNSNQDSKTAKATQNPSLTIVKQIASSASGPWEDSSITVQVGATVYYQITVANTGNITLTSVHVADDLCTLSGPTGDTDGDSKLDTKESWVYTCSMTAQAGSHKNTATVNTDQTSPASDDATYFAQNPIIGLAKQASSVKKVSAGTYDVTFVLKAQNYGNVTLSNLTLTDDLTAAFPAPAYFSVQSITGSGLAVNSGFNGDSDKNLLASGNSLDAGASGFTTLVVRVIPTSNGPFNNTASISGMSSLAYTATDVSQDGSNPDSDGDGNPKNNNVPTPVDFGSRIFEPSYGIKSGDFTKMPEMKWTMYWINNKNIVSVANSVHDPIPTGTTYYPGSTDSGFSVPGGAPAGSTSMGVACTVSGKSVTTECYYEGPTTGNPRGQIIWEGTLGPDFGITNPTLAANALQITFSVKLSSSQKKVVNTATVDTDLNGNGNTTDAGEQNLASASADWNYAGYYDLPVTGFAPGIITKLPDQPRALNYSTMNDVWLEIPSLDVQSTVVGVPQTSNGWNVSWLGKQVGWLNGTAFPTYTGNAVLTGHVFDENGLPGPFASIDKLKYGDQIIIHAWNQEYLYEIRETKLVAADDSDTVLKHEDLAWITLLTCRDYDEKSKTYLHRYIVRAVLVKVK